MSELVRGTKTQARVVLWAILALALTTERTASALNINLTHDPDATFVNAGLTATDITNMKAARRLPDRKGAKLKAILFYCESLKSR